MLQQAEGTQAPQQHTWCMAETMHTLKQTVPQPSKDGRGLLNRSLTLWKKWQYFTLSVYMMTSLRPSSPSISASVANSTILMVSGMLLVPL